MTTHQEILRGHFDGAVCIGVPVAEGYPVAPPPPLTAASGGATHNYLDSDESSPAMSKHRRYLWYTLEFISAIISLCLFLFEIVHLLSKPYPSFKVESISVALDKSDISNNQSQVIRAAWDIGFSIKNPGRDFSVSVRCMSYNWSANARNTTTSSDAIVITPLPREVVLPELMVQGLTLQYDVSFRTNHGRETVEGMCKNMTIAISPNATQGVMLGGQRLCQVH